MARFEWTPALIKSECANVVEGDLMNSLLFYFSEYPEYRDLFVHEFKQACVSLIDEVKANVEREV